MILPKIVIEPQFQEVSASEILLDLLLDLLRVTAGVT